jgi:tetratricopeptide (TPR) repeat protein
MPCPHCGSDAAPRAGRCPSCGAVAQPEAPAVVTGLLTPAPAGTSGVDDQTRLGTSAPGAPVSPGPTGLSGQSRLQAPVPLQVGQNFGTRYHIIRLLGSGGMGSVYQAWDQELEVAVAVKVIRPEMTADATAAQDLQRRFKRELLLARQVTHKNVVRIHDIGEIDGIKYITMPYVQGSDLATILGREGRMPLNRALSIGRQVVAGLVAAHEAGVVHRDLKPANIMVDAEDHAMIMDFGIARSTAGTTGFSMTVAGAVIGTVEYMAPEQAKGEAIDQRADVYAWGLILHDMLLGGRQAGAANTAVAELMARMQQAPSPLRVHDPAIPETIDALVTRCLQPSPSDRYQTSAELLRDLDRIIQGGDVQVVIPTTGWRRKLPAGRRRLAAAAGAVVALLSLAALPPVRSFVARHVGVDQGIPPASRQKLIAVLPFRSLGAPGELEHIGNGVAEGLTAKLFGLSGVTVAPDSAVEQADLSKPPVHIARELGSNLLVSGTVQGGAGRISIVVNLEEPLANHRIWTHAFDGNPKDILTLQDQIFAGLVEALEITPSTAERAKTVSRPTSNVAAYDVYLKGRNAMRGQQDRRNVEAAIKFYEQALEADPRFALAHAGLADASLQMYRETHDRLWADKAVFASEQGKRLDETLPEVRLALGRAYLATGKTNEAIAELKRALELSPNSDEGYRRLAGAYQQAGMTNDAIAMHQKAIEVNPYYWLNYNALGATYWEIGQYERAAVAFKKVIELEPENVNGYNDLGAMYLQTGRYAEAADAFRRALAIVPTADTYSNLGIAYAWEGRLNEALPAYEKAVELSPQVDGWLSNLADAYRWSGQQEKANATYDKAIALAYKALQVNSNDAVTRCNLGTYYAKKGDTQQALKFVQEAEAANPGQVTILYNVAVVRALAGHDDQALVALRKALKAGYPARFAEDDPDLKRLARHSRFKSILREFRPAT